MKKHDPSWEVQQTVRQRDEAFDRFFKYLKKKQKNPFIKPKESPPDKHKTHGDGSFKLAKGCGWKLVEGGVQVGRLWNNFGIPKDIHTYKFFGKREVLGEVKNAVFKRDRCGDYWCIITTTHTPFKHLPKTGEVGGFDFSQEHFFVGDDGRCWDIPAALEQNLDEVRRISLRMRKAKEGSGNRRRWRKKLARVFRKIKNQRKEYHYVLAWKMCQEYDILCFEDNDYAEMHLRKRVVNGHKVTRKQRQRLRALAPASFLTILKEVAKKADKTVFFADQHFASSQACSNCGHINKALKQLKVRKWTCLKCGAKHDRDVNAAKNLVKEFKRTVGGASSIETETKKESEKTTYWERIRKSSAVKRGAGSGEKSPCPRKPQVSCADKADGTEPKCPELYTDASSTVKIKEGEHGTVRKERCWTVVEKPPG